MRVYILSSYGEYGAENVRATLNKEHLPNIFDIRDNEVIYECREENFTEKNLNEIIETLKEERATLLELLQSDEIIQKSGQDLAIGWGGFQLHIIELE